MWQKNKFVIVPVVLVLAVYLAVQWRAWSCQRAFARLAPPNPTISFAQFAQDKQARHLAIQDVEEGEALGFDVLIVDDKIALVREVEAIW